MSPRKAFVPPVNTGLRELNNLHSANSLRRLEQIARLRARGIGNHIALPQLVVCGDQSAGKSSVLEGLTGIPFPRQDGLCTTFATEIILQHRPGEISINASIIASASRTSEEKATLGQFHERFSDFKDLAYIIKTASEIMGVRQPGSQMKGPAFAEDVLRIEVQSPSGLHLSVVDLPGLIAVPNEDQTDRDVATVHRLVDKYAADSRTIILAVVQAGNDIANQPIVKKARTYDAAGERTVGIITKPDLINKTTEGRIALLAANKDTTKLKLGFFLVKNPSPSELNRGISAQERHENETRYFQSSPWKEQALDPTRTGVLALRAFLKTLLDRHIEKELPKVREEIGALLLRTDEQVKIMGEERTDASRRRTYLTRLASSFSQICTSALSGTYEDPSGSYFGTGEQQRSRRLRATVQHLNTQFAADMRDNSAKRKFAVGPGNEVSDWVKQIYRASRGRELPGTYKNVLLAELFREQASPWYDMANDHVHSIGDTITAFVEGVLAHTISDERVRQEVQEVAATTIRNKIKAALDELRRLWEDENCQPVTYNHYFTDNIQKARQQSIDNQLKKACQDSKELDGKKYVTKTDTGSTINFDQFLGSLQRRVVVNMEEQACTEALAALEAYYKVALKTFVDNVCRQVVERHMLRPLQSVFSPEMVAGMSEDELSRIAQETEEATLRRQQLHDLSESLSVSLRELRPGRGLVG